MNTRFLPTDWRSDEEYLHIFHMFFFMLYPLLLESYRAWLRGSYTLSTNPKC